MFIDNFYTSPKLVNDLIKKGRFSVEIVYPNRKSDQYSTTQEHGDSCALILPLQVLLLLAWHHHTLM